jgi:hypothetical protein
MPNKSPIFPPLFHPDYVYSMNADAVIIALVIVLIDLKLKPQKIAIWFNPQMFFFILDLALP